MSMNGNGGEHGAAERTEGAENCTDFPGVAMLLTIR